MKPENVTIFRCLEGHIHETALDAANCNIKKRLIEAMDGKGQFPCKSIQEAGGNARDSAGPLAKLVEVGIVAWWVTHNTTALEHLLQQYLDDLGSDRPMPKQEGKVP